jgi:hypothetical protein
MGGNATVLAVIVIGVVVCLGVGAAKRFTIGKTLEIMGNALLHPIETLRPRKKGGPHDE